MSDLTYDEKDGRPELARKYQRTERWGRVMTFLIIAYFVLATAILVWNAYTGAKTRQTLVDCTTPSGDCAQESQRQTGKAINQLIKAGTLGDVATQQVVIYAAACEKQPVVQQETNIERRVDLLLECVERQKRADR